MTLTIEKETPPLRQDKFGAVRVGDSRVLLELVIRAFQDGASAESIVQRYPTLSLSDTYTTIGYYLRHQPEVQNYLQHREEKAESVKQKIIDIQPDTAEIRARLLAQKQV